MNFKARFERKANAPEVTDADIVGVVTLNQEQFAWFSERLLDDYDFIADYSKETYDDGERKHCLLVLGAGEDDGILVCSEGSFYARYSAYLPKARQILRDEVHRVAELMIKGRFGETENGSWVIGFDDIKEHFDLTVSPTNGIGEMLLGELEVQEEVGLKVKNIHYYKSQPWGFDQDLLLGYFCELDGERNIVLDTGELATAEWVHYSDVPEDPEGLSLTREMMSVFQQKFLSEKMS
mgnify:CR=1 FL=1